MSELTNEQIEFLTLAAKNHLLNFCETVNPVYESQWFHERIADALEDAVQCALQKKKKRIILSVPPRHGKSQEASIYFPAWALGKYPWLKFIVSTYGAELAEKNGKETRDLIASDAYKMIFPNVTLMQDMKARANWLVEHKDEKNVVSTRKGQYYAVGVGGAVTGYGADIIIIDDPHKDRAEAESETMRKAVWDYYRSTLYSRKEGEGVIIVIMQRWRQDDLVGLLLEEDEKLREAGEQTEDWELISLPAIAEEDEYYRGEVVRKEGESLWPSKFPLNVLESIKQLSPYYWACTPKETPILMANWTFKPISEIKVGDEVIGFARGNTKGGKSAGIKLTVNEKERAELKTLNDSQRARLVKTVVKETFCKKDIVYDLKMKSGRVIRCTKDHKWYAGRFDNKRNTYKTPKVGGLIPFVIDSNIQMSEQEKMNWNYLGGIVDGEGSIKRGVIDIAQSPEKNGPTCDRIEKVLNDLNLKYIKDVRIRKQQNPKWTDCNRYVVHDVKYTYPRLIQIANCGKSDQMRGWLNHSTGAFIKDMDKVLEMTPGKTEEDVYAMETETGNYIAWGYASSNSQYQQNPILAETAEFKKDMFQYYTQDDIKYKNLRYYTLVDPAISQKKSADNAVVLTVAKEIGGPNMYRIREDAGKYTPQQLVDLIFLHNHEYKSDVWIETIAYQEALKYIVKERQVKDQKYFVIHEIKSRSAKETRIRGLLGLYQNKVIWHLAGKDTNYELELLSFPKGRRDDRADCMAFMLTALEDYPSSGMAAKQYKPKWNGYGKKL